VIARVTAVVTAGLFLAAGLEGLFAGGLLGAYSLRGGVGTAVSFAVLLSTHRGMSRFVDRLLPT
jgi:Na+/glutamate symporter